MFTEEQYITIANMQNDLNIATAGEDWIDQNLAWDTATFVEAAECMNHLGWEWWKKPTPHIEQAKMEIVDMLHFAMSGALSLAKPDVLYSMTVNAVNEMHPAQVAEMNNWNTFQAVKEIALTAVVGNFGFSVYLCTVAASTLGMTADDLYKAYIGKNVLNKFRKAHGYKDGSYIKIWNGREDNEHLTDVLNATDSSRSDFIQIIEQQLEAIYALIKQSKTH